MKKKFYFIQRIFRIVGLLFSYTLSLISFGYSQEIQWQNTIGGNASDHFSAIEKTTDGGYILGGSSYSDISGDKSENNIGGSTTSDYWIVKTDSLGNIQWENTIGGAHNDMLSCILQTTDGGYLLGGWSSSNISGDKTENCLGFPDYWIVKTDAIGNIQWQNTIGGSSLDELHSVQQTTDGGFILGGHSPSNISGDKTENSNGSYDIWILKVNSLGNIQWQNTIGGSLTELLYDIQQTTDGGFILGGMSSSNISGDKTENCFGSYDYWIIKINSSGIIQWQNTIGGSDWDELRSIQQTADGGYILGGFSESDISGNKTENSLGMEDYWVVKTDAIGNLQWQNTIGGSDLDELYSIQQTAGGEYLLGGFSQSGISGDKTENPINLDDLWVMKIDTIGNIQWQNTIGANNLDIAYSFLQTSDGKYIIGGLSSSNVSGDKTENSLGDVDYWIVKVTGNYNLIKGKLFIDANGNNVQDVGEYVVTNKQVAEINTGRFGFSEQNGHYSVSVLDSGNFSVSPVPINYYNAVPATHSVYFSGIQQIDSLNDFAFQPAGVFNDLCVSITPLGAFRAGFNASYMINYSNVGTTTLSPTVIFFPDNPVTYVSSNPVANSVTADSVVWNFGALAPFQTGSILVTVNVTTGTIIGTLINSGVRIEPVAGDANTVCNYAAWEVYSTGAVDPNDIIVDEDTLLTTQFPNPPYLEYIIRFQNTGNDTCFNAKILNPIDTFKLQLNTLEFVASSHPVNMSWIPWERNMEFTFDNILLPDSNVNEPMSHGFIRYRIKPKSTLVAGDSIVNNAAIYFDFNAPVITNNAVTRVVLPTDLTPNPSPKERGVAVYPNPTSGTLTITVKPPLRGGLEGLVITDLFGRKVFELQTSNLKPQTTIDVSSLSNGVYFIEAGNEKSLLRAKFVKQ